MKVGLSLFTKFFKAPSHREGVGDGPDEGISNIQQGISNEEGKADGSLPFSICKISKPLPTGKGGWGWAGLPLRTIHILILSKRVDQTNRG
jgi:hypothetical protein